MWNYQTMRPVDNPDHGMVELSFNTVKETEAPLAALRRLWPQVKSTVAQEEGRAEIIESVSSKTC